jgi:hypothetical protein
MAEVKVERKLMERQRFWLSHLQAWEKSGKSIRSYASLNSLDLKPFYNWKSLLSSKGLYHCSTQRPFFQKLKIERSTANCRLHLPNGAMVEWSASLSVDDLTSLAQALGKLP